MEDTIWCHQAVLRQEAESESQPLEPCPVCGERPENALAVLAYILTARLPLSAPEVAVAPPNCAVFAPCLLQTVCRWPGQVVFAYTADLIATPLLGLGARMTPTAQCSKCMQDGRV